MKRCKRCKSILEDDGRCWRCAFVPSIGAAPAPYREPLAATKDMVDMEDDYSEASTPDSVCRETSAVYRRDTPRG